MTTKKESWKSEYSLGEEIANAITHGIGVGLAIAMLVLLIVQAARHGTAWHVVSYTLFGSMMVILYLASTLYHSIPPARKVFRRIDHAAIFLLIAGTYTPFCLVSLRGAWGWTLFGIVWGLAIIGVVMKTAFAHKYEKASVAVYILMGWLVVIAAKPAMANIDKDSLIALFIGGLSYTGGVVFYAWEKLPYNHAIWHLFVLGGSIAHFFAVLFILW